MTAVAIGPLAAGNPARYATLALLVGLLAVVAWLVRLGFLADLLSRPVLIFLFTAQSQWPRLPGPLAAVLLSTAVCAIFGLGRHGVALVGHIPAGLPTPGQEPTTLGGRD
jgi:MFS superfamily sulfate permease-like transporter